MFARLLAALRRSAPLSPSAAPTAAPEARGPLLLVLTGAGVSAESGLPTFRDSNGLWAGSDVRAVATSEGFARDPEKVMAFYDERARDAAKAVPNAAHRALAELERGWPGEFLLLTTNVDSLHEAAGSQRVRHLHGRLDTVRCVLCGQRRPRAGALAGTPRTCPACGAPGAVRPDVVWFGERPFHLDEAHDAVDRCETLLVIGCSGVVAPASRFPRMARRNYLREPRLGQSECRVIEINPRPSDDANFTEVLVGKAGALVPRWVASTLAVAASQAPAA